MDLPEIDATQRWLLVRGIALLVVVLGWVQIIPLIGPINTILSGFALAGATSVLMAVWARHVLRTHRESSKKLPNMWT